MMKKRLTALCLAAFMAAASLTGCSGSGSPAAAETTSESAAEVKADVSLDELLADIKEAYGDKYAPSAEMDAELLESIVGLTPDLYEEYVAEMPMISTFVETFIGVKAAEGKGDEVEKIITAYRDRLVNDTMQYPMNISKIQASQVVRHGDYVFFVMLGAADDDAMEKGDEAALESARKNNQTAIDVIDGYFK